MPVKQIEASATNLNTEYEKNGCTKSWWYNRYYQTSAPTNADPCQAYGQDSVEDNKNEDLSPIMPYFSGS